MPEVIEVTSPTVEIKPGDAKGSGSGNLSMGQAAVQLLASAEKSEQQKRAQLAAAEKAPVANSETTTETPAAEAQPASEPEVTTEEPAATAETTEAATEPSAEAATDTVHSQIISFTPEQQEIFNKRVGKEMAKTKAIQSQMEEAKTRLADLEAKLAQRAAPEQATAPAPVVVLGNQPLADQQDLLSLGKLQQTAKDAIRYVEDVLDDPAQWKTVTVPDPTNNGEEKQVKVHQIGDQLYTETDLRRQMRKAKVTLEDQIPQRANFLVARQQAQQLAHADFPFLKDKSSAEYQQAEAARRDPQYAAIMAAPNADWIIGVQIEGLKAIAARKAIAKAKADASATKPKIAAAKPAADQTVVTTSGAITRQPIGSAERQAAAAKMTELSKKGGIRSEDAVEQLLQIERLRKSR